MARHEAKTGGGKRTQRVLLAVIGFGLAILAGWGFMGTRVIAGLNPTLAHTILAATRPALDVWIMPPQAGAQPIIISTPAGARFQGDTIAVPAGSVVSAHLARLELPSGDAPDLVYDGDSKPFSTDAHGDFAASAKLTGGGWLAVRRGWFNLASWRIRIVTDAAPKAAFVAPPAVTGDRHVHVSWRASDDAARVALRVSAPDGGAATEIPLTAGAQSADEDLTALPLAGGKAVLQIVAVSADGRRGLSAPAAITLPERAFFHPVARILVEERARLMQHPDDPALRNEAANVMAGIAHETADYGGDPVVLMALRAGAVRLVLDQDRAAADSASDLLWQTALRIENGRANEAERRLRDARRDLATAIDHNAGGEEIARLTGQLQQAMADYIAHLALHAGVVKVHAPANAAAAQGADRM